MVSFVVQLGQLGFVSLTSLTVLKAEDPVAHLVFMFIVNSSYVFLAALHLSLSEHIFATSCF